MMVFHAIIPARFLALTAHLVLNIMLYWSRSHNVETCVPLSVEAGSPQYNAKDTQLLVALSLSLVFTVTELLGFFSGLSLFTTLPNMFSAATHIAATICLAYFTVNRWPCDQYWYIFGFCSIPPLFVEVLVVIATIKFKLFN